MKYDDIGICWRFLGHGTHIFSILFDFLVLLQFSEVETQTCHFVPKSGTDLLDDHAHNFDFTILLQPCVILRCSTVLNLSRR